MSAQKVVVAGALSIILLVLIVSLFFRADFTEPSVFPEAVAPSETLWEVRDFETILQGLVILGGVFAILMILRSSRREVSR